MNHTMIRLCAALLLIGLGLFWHKPAEAQVVATCSATMTAINFNSVNPQSSQTDVTGTLNYSCNNIDNNPQTLSLCFNLLGQDTDPRLMSDGAGHTLQFQLYTDNARTQIWGNPGYGTQLQESLLQIPKGQSAGGSVSIYARVLNGQTTAVAGSYIDNFPAGQATLTFTSHNGGGQPPSCAAGGTPGSFSGFTVSANVTAQCTVNATPLDFGTPAGVLNAAITAQTNVQVQCAPNIAYNVGLDGGQNSGGDVNARKMVLGSNAVGYQLYRDSSRTQVWGTTVNTDTVQGMGDGSTRNLTVYGKVPPQTTPPAGTYNDTVVVSVTY